MRKRSTNIRRIFEERFRNRHLNLHILRVNREYKDRVFKDLFGDRENLLSLYNAVNGSNLTDAEGIEINTLNGALYITMHNDLSFVVDLRLNLYEQQSTYNPNLPLRGFLYFGDLLAGLYGGSKLYSTRLLKLPVPQFVVFYNGLEAAPEREALKLSDAFIRKDIKGCLECEATLININAGMNVELVKSCSALFGYVSLVEKIKEGLAKGLQLSKAVATAVDWCIANDILCEYLQRHRREVLGMFLSEFDEKAVKKMWKEEAYEDGEQAGFERGDKIGFERGDKTGFERASRANAEAMLSDGMPAELVAKYSGMPVESVEALIVREDDTTNK